VNKPQNKPKKVVLAYSGGLDTCIILPSLKETYGCKEITLTVYMATQDELTPP
jgi:argininosuccinate synthase